MDAFTTWVHARWDADAVPLGEIEGVGLSDASKLMQIHGWSLHRITGTYVWLGAACLAAMVIVYVRTPAGPPGAPDRSDDFCCMRKGARALPPDGRRDSRRP